jgi:biopolymer transport protein ExbD
MKFLTRKRRTAPAVIIVALIDVLIVLVIFLLVTTTFKQVPALKLELPNSHQALKQGVADNPPLIVTIGPGDTGLRLGADNMPMTIDQVREEFTARAAKNPNLKLASRADKEAPWGSVVAVMDAAEAAHIKLMSAYTKQPGSP